MRRFVAGLTATAAVVASALVFTGQGAQAATTGPSATASAAESVSRPDAISAQVTARVEGHPVIDESQSTPYTTVSADPDGSWTESTAAVPVQAQQPDGTWAPIDTTLQTAKSGALVPANVPDPVSFSTDGSTSVASMTLGQSGYGSVGSGQKVSWLWPTKLPKPTVSGSTATYQVTATEQLVLTATPTGFSEDIVLTAPPATKADATFSLPMQTGATTLTTHAVPSTSDAAADGPTTPALQLKTSHGQEALSVAPPVAYDATATAAMGGAKPLPGTSHVSALGVAVAPGTGHHTRLTLSPDWAWLTAPTTTYPVTIDPSFSSTANQDTFITSGSPNTNYGETMRLEAGYNNAGSNPYVARTLLKFNRTAMTNLAGKDIRSATLSMWNYAANSCTQAPLNVYRITDTWGGDAVTWNTRPSTGGYSFDSFSPAYGYSSACPQGSASWDVTPVVAGWADGSYPMDGLEIAANNENNAATWRAYRSYEA